MDPLYRTGFQVALEIKNPLPMQEMQDTRVQSLGGEDPLEDAMAS